jgi:hypothetical protein
LGELVSNLLSAPASASGAAGIGRILGAFSRPRLYSSPRASKGLA